MSGNKKNISVVIPSYNRPERLSNVIDHLLRSDLEGFSAVEIVVVDDGSPNPVKAVVEEKSPPSPITLRYLSQENSGPAVARNKGFRNSSGDIVLFIDDDILVPPGHLKAHAEAHDRKPSTVIVGPCPCDQPENSVPSARFIRALEAVYMNGFRDHFTRIDTVVSGNLSIERRMFAADNGLYNDSLRSPTAEEFDVIAKLKRRQIPVFLVKELAVVHLQSTSIEATCMREYKHAVGIGELAIKSPELIAELPELQTFVTTNGIVEDEDTFMIIVKKRAKKMLAGERSRGAILRLVKIAERILPIDAVMFPLFKFIIGLNIFAGVRDGKKTFGKGSDA